MIVTWNICCVLFVVGDKNGWLNHNKMFSFETKMLIVARYDYMNSLKIPSTLFHKTILFIYLFILSFKLTNLQYEK